MKSNKTVSLKNEITEGVIWKQLLLFFFPILLGSFFQQLYNTVDAIIVGRFVGKNALAAVGGSAGLIINLVILFFVGLTSGASVVVSQYFGSGDRKKVDDGIHTIYAFSIIGSIVIMILGILLTTPLLELMNTPEELMTESTRYLQIYFAGIIFTFIYNTGSGLLRALGDSKRPLYCLIICCMINVILDLVFVLIFHMGIVGAAVATVIAQAISAVLVTWFLMTSTDLCSFSLRQIRIHLQTLKIELRLGLPSGLQFAMYSVSNMIVQSAINAFGTDSAAAWAAYGKMDALFWMVSGAFGTAITTFVGQNYGAGKIDRVKKSIRVGIGIDFLISVFMAVFFFLLRVPLFHIFVADAAVVEIGCRMLVWITPFYFTFVFTEIFSGALRGIGDVMIPMCITVGGICVFRVVWILIVLPLNPTLITTMLTYPVSWVLTSSLFLIYYIYRSKHLK